MAALLAALILSGCGQTAEPAVEPVQPDMGPGVSADGGGAAAEPLPQMTEESDEVPTAPYSGDGYAICLPDEGWIEERPSRWHAAEDAYVALQVERWEGTVEDPMTEQRCYESIVERYGSGDDGYDFAPLEGNAVLGTCSGCILQARLVEDEEDCWAVCGFYLADTAESLRAQLTAIADTFTVDN